MPTRPSSPLQTPAAPDAPRPCSRLPAGALAGLSAAALALSAVQPALADNQQVQVQDNAFLLPGVAVKPGEAVTWTYPGSTDVHNVHFDDQSFIAPDVPSAAWTRTRTFTSEPVGMYRYHCDEHGGFGGQGMSGVVYVNAAGTVPGTPPVASFTVSPGSVTVGQNVRFSAAGTSDPDGTILRHEWDLDGNGSYERDTRTTPTISRSYPSAGARTIRLRVTDNQGHIDATTRSLSVSRPAVPPPVAILPPVPPLPPPPPSFAASRRSVTVGKTGRFAFRFRAGAGLKGTISLRSVAKVRVSARRRVSLGTKRFTVPASRTMTSRWKLSRKNLRILKRNRRIRFRVTVKLRDAAGLTRSGTTTLTLKKPRR